MLALFSSDKVVAELQPVKKTTHPVVNLRSPQNKRRWAPVKVSAFMSFWSVVNNCIAIIYSTYKSVRPAGAEMLQLLSKVLCIGQQGIFDAASALSDRSQLMEAWEHGGGRAVQWFLRLHRQAPSKFGALGSYGTEALSFDELPGHV